MIPHEQSKTAQLPLPFHPNPIAGLTEEDRATALTVLAQLLLAAAGVKPEEMGDER